MKTNNKAKRLGIVLSGSGPVIDLLAAKIRARPDLRLASSPVAESDAVVPAGTDCIVHVPTGKALVDGSAAAQIVAWLRAGNNVVSTVPMEALAGTDVLAACREGRSCFHGTGGYQTRLVSRFNRAFASIARNIRDVELIEERDVAELPTDDARASEGFYAAGLHTLADAVFCDAMPDVAVSSKASHRDGCDVLSSRIGKCGDPVEQLVVRRSLGEHLAYDTHFRRREPGDAPRAGSSLRYRLNTQSSDAIGHVTIEIHAGDGVDPADQLACGGLLDAIRPVCESRPGILRHELGINQVMLNACLA